MIWLLILYYEAITRTNVVKFIISKPTIWGWFIPPTMVITIKKHQLDIINHNKPLLYCGWLRNPASPNGWLKPYK